MLKTIVGGIVIVAVGAFIGSFLGRFLGIYLPPHGHLHDLMAQDFVGGLHPTTLDLSVIQLTLGCVLRLNGTSILGIILAAFIYKKIIP